MKREYFKIDEYGKLEREKSVDEHNTYPHKGLAVLMLICVASCSFVGWVIYSVTSYWGW